MADEPLAPTTSQTPAPASPAPSAPAMTGSASFEAQMDSLAPPETSKPAEAKPAAAPATAKPPEVPKPDKPSAPAAKPVAPVPSKTGDQKLAGAVSPSLDWKTAPVQFRAAHEKLLEEHTKTKTTLESQLQTLNQKIAEYDRKAFLTPEQQAKYAAMEKRQQELESNLYSRDYRESPEFSEKFEKPWKAKYQNALAEIGGLNVIGKDAEGNPTSRPATKADFDKILSITSTVQARRAAREMFGDDADVALQFRSELQAIEQAGESAVNEKRSTWNNQQKESFERSKQLGQKNAEMMKGFDQALIQTYPQYFGEDPTNPEATEAYRQGLKIVDDAVNNPNAPLEDQIKTAALMRQWAASWPRDQKIIAQSKARIESLEAELAKYRGSDPGSGGENGGGESAPKRGGTDAMIEMFKDGV